MGKPGRIIGSVVGGVGAVLVALAALVPLALPGTRPAYLPDPKLTPGEILPVTAAETCVPGYAGKVRNVTEAMKREVFRRYGIPVADRMKYEVDHLIPLCLGGANAARNLFPQPWAGPLGAREKDKLEDRLRSLVCGGKMTLLEAQAAFRTDWTIAYRKYVPPGPSPIGPPLFQGEAR